MCGTDSHQKSLSRWTSQSHSLKRKHGKGTEFLLVASASTVIIMDVGLHCNKHSVLSPHLRWKLTPPPPTRLSHLYKIPWWDSLPGISGTAVISNLNLQSEHPRGSFPLIFVGNDSDLRILSKRGVHWQTMYKDPFQWGPFPSCHFALGQVLSLPTSRLPTWWSTTSQPAASSAWCLHNLNNNFA